jgi:TPR repeat protein
MLNTFFVATGEVARAVLQVCQQSCPKKLFWKKWKTQYFCPKLVFKLVFKTSSCATAPSPNYAPEEFTDAAPQRPRMPPSTKDVELRLLRDCAEAGDAWAQLELGRCCYEGDGVPQTYSEAVRYFRLAADQGDAEAQGSLAACYRLGRGVAKNEREAYRLLTLSAEQGYAPSQLLLDNAIRAAEGLDVSVPREDAWVLAQRAQLARDTATRTAILGLLGEHADDRNVARTCCIGCGKTEQLQVCAKCLTAKFCSRECQRRVWPTHMQACRAWAEQKAAAAAEVGEVASSSAQAESGEAGDAEADEAAKEGAYRRAEDDVATLPANERDRRLDGRKISYAGVGRSELAALLESALKALSCVHSPGGGTRCATRHGSPRSVRLRPGRFFIIFRSKCSSHPPPYWILEKEVYLFPHNIQ